MSYDHVDHEAKVRIKSVPPKGREPGFIDINAHDVLDVAQRRHANISANVTQISARDMGDRTTPTTGDVGTDYFSVEITIESNETSENTGTVRRLDEEAESLVFSAQMPWTSGFRIKSHGTGNHRMSCSSDSNCEAQWFAGVSLACICKRDVVPNQESKTTIAGSWVGPDENGATNSSTKSVDIIINLPGAFFADFSSPGWLLALILPCMAAVMLWLAMELEENRDMNHKLDPSLLCTDVQLPAGTKILWIFGCCTNTGGVECAEAVLQRIQEARRQMHKARQVQEFSRINTEDSQASKESDLSLYAFMKYREGFPKRGCLIPAFLELTNLCSLWWMVLQRNHPLSWIWNRRPWQTTKQECMISITSLGVATAMLTLKFVYKKGSSIHSWECARSEGCHSLFDVMETEGLQPSVFHGLIFQNPLTPQRWLYRACLGAFASFLGTAVLSFIGSFFVKEPKVILPSASQDGRPANNCCCCFLSCLQPVRTPEEQIIQWAGRAKVGRLLAGAFSLLAFYFIWALRNELLKTGVDECLEAFAYSTFTTFVAMPLLSSLMFAWVLWLAQRVTWFDRLLAFKPLMLDFLQREYPDDVNAQVRAFVQAIRPEPGVVMEPRPDTLESFQELGNSAYSAVASRMSFLRHRPSPVAQQNSIGSLDSTVSEASMQGDSVGGLRGFARQLSRHLMPARRRNTPAGHAMEDTTSEPNSQRTLVRKGTGYTRGSVRRQSELTTLSEEPEGIELSDVR
eukprot:gnl/MRDRNA2_/MRDRNA2_160179_c0_seq1.p1 gnl/MRDRNA2_/MRDRNA2_160179_c0~~gnl/MRDRNA2_/MRDRNA2_160179_c0_seq1.p1  ORF type:complete len:841 (-),score=89.94 gnl/MRDRNA2_/MRDRNA2_160179_c0_seq1:108-2336(-)